jgi:aryl-alcohol dehydrogenase-like predicted oxidoreductase
MRALRSRRFVSAPARSAAATSSFSAGAQTDVAEAKRIVDLCLDAGLNFFDTADIYSKGASEEILGQALEGQAGPGIDLDQGHLPDGRRRQ